MNKIILAAALLVSGLAQAETAKINCSGQGLSLDLVVQNKVTMTETVEATLVDANLEESKKIEMLVTTQILKKGEYYRDQEVRLYQGYSEDRSLEVGFIIAQVLDENQKEVRFNVNKFGKDRIELGKCTVQ